MTFISLEPFVPSGSNFDNSKQLFQELGFVIRWEQDGMTGFEKDNCKFILQEYDVPGFPENYMLSVRVDDVEAFYKMVVEKQLPEKYGIRITKPKIQPYGKEVILIDVAGVCWHFVQ